MTARKTSKNQPAKDVAAVPAAAGASQPEATAIEAAVAPKKATKTAKSSTRKTAAKKKPAAGRAAKKTAQRRRPVAAQEPSEVDIRLRAYFIAERRVQLALQGDPAMDWIQAREELVAEQRKSAE